MASKEDTAVVSPNLGLYLGMPPLIVPERGIHSVSATLNVQISSV